MVVLGRSNYTPLADASWAGVWGLDSLMCLFPGYHGTFCVGAYVLVGKSFGVSLTYGLVVGAVIFDDLVRAYLLVVAKEQDHHYGDWQSLFHRRRRLDLDRNHSAGMRSIGFARCEE